MVTLGRNFQWASPHYIETMYCDALDHQGMGYWYNDILSQHKELENKKK